MRLGGKPFEELFLGLAQFRRDNDLNSHILVPLAPASLA
jgi:hypothetical protein